MEQVKCKWREFLTGSVYIVQWVLGTFVYFPWLCVVSVWIFDSFLFVCFFFYSFYLLCVCFNFCLSINKIAPFDYCICLCPEFWVLTLYKLRKIYIRKCIFYSFYLKKTLFVTPWSSNSPQAHHKRIRSPLLCLTCSCWRCDIFISLYVTSAASSPACSSTEIKQNKQ